MSEWWTYRPSDFLMFAPDTYWRLFELHNAAWWPLGLLANLLCLALPMALARQPALGARLAAGLLAVLSACAAWGFVWQLYAPVNWGAQPLAALLAVAAVGWLVLSPTAVARRTPHGSALLWAASVGWPLLALLGGRPWGQAELVGLAPDPTVAAGLGLLLHLRVSQPALRLVWWLLFAVAAIGCLASAATLATLGSLQALAPLGALGLAAAGLRGRRDNA